MDLCGLAVPTAPRARWPPRLGHAACPRGPRCGARRAGRALHRRADVAAWGHRHRLRPAAPAPLAWPRTRRSLPSCGAHMSGLPLNGHLTALAAASSRRRHRARLSLLRAARRPADPPGPCPRDERGRITLELWAMPTARMGDFLATSRRRSASVRSALPTGGRHRLSRRSRRHRRRDRHLGLRRLAGVSGRARTLRGRPSPRVTSTRSRDLVEPSGIEPLTSSLRTTRSPN